MMDPRYYGDGRPYDEEEQSYARGGSYMRGPYDEQGKRYSGHATKADIKKDLQEMMK